MHNEHKIKLFACRASKEFATKVAKAMNLELGAADILTFSDGEFQPCLNESVRGATVFIIQSTFPPCENLFELLQMIDAAKRASAHKVIAVMPYYGWARQDRKDKPRVSIGAKLVANMLNAAGCDRVMTCDLHADQIQGFFDFPIDHIYASAVFLPYIKAKNIENLAIAAPDMGGAKRANAYARYLECPVIICHKSREKANVVGSITAIGDVKGKNVIIVDDMISSGDSVLDIGAKLKAAGANRIFICTTFGLFCNGLTKFDEAYEKGHITKVFTTNLNYRPQELIDRPWYQEVDMSKSIAHLIDTINHDGSISELLEPVHRINKLLTEKGLKK